MTAVLWLRRDLRLADHPAALAAAAAGEVVPVFVVDPRLWERSGPARRAFLTAALADLDRRLGGALVVRHGDPVAEIPALAAAAGAAQVHVSADVAPYGRHRDTAVGAALARAGGGLVATGSPYAVTPGRVRRDDGRPYQVFTPFHRAWLAHGWRPSAPAADRVRWTDAGLPHQPLPAASGPPGDLPEPAEPAALARWAAFRDGDLAGYRDRRDRLELDGTSRLSAYLRFGLLHPRTLLADLDDGPGAVTFRSELAWREFYADVLWHAPGSAREYLRPQLAGMAYDRGPAADARLLAWQEGRTGYPVVDAGMRQLVASGWLHNRARMLVASFLVKDLHLEWTAGARFFMRHLVDGDLASNSHGWQWVAGSGTDAAPYFRIFNPVTQGLRHDPDGAYVRRWVTELRGVDGPRVHEPWTLPGGPPPGYPARIVEHAVERVEALTRYQAVRTARAGSTAPGPGRTPP